MATFQNGSTPTVVLVHGAFADGSSWAGVIRELQAHGIDTIAPAVTLRGLASDAAYVASVAEQFDGPVLLVGHSYGGSVIGVAAALAHNVVGLVFVAAFVLGEGESSSEASAAFPSTRFGASVRPADFRDANGEPAIDLYLKTATYPEPDAMPHLLAADLPDATRNVLAAVQRPIAAAALDERARHAAWRTLRSWYVVATADRAIHPDAQRHMARRAGALTTEVDGSHLVAVSQPSAVAAVILSAAHSVRPTARAAVA